MTSPDMLLVDKTGGAGSAGAREMHDNVDRVKRDGVTAWVASGPGGDAGRATELALDAVEAERAGIDDSKIFDDIDEKLARHARALGLDYREAEDIATETVDEMRRGLHDGRGAGWVTMGPERYQAAVYALMLAKASVDAVVLDPTRYIRRDRHGAIDMATSVRLLSPQLADPNLVYVLPGSLGENDDLQTVTATKARRGYSDPTGVVVAAALHEARGRQVEYRNIKGEKISGILRMPPGLGIDPEVTPELSIIEAGVLGAGGNEVIHASVLGLLQQTEDVSLRVCSGIQGEIGTSVLRHRKIDKCETIAGIALQEVVALMIDDIQMEHHSGDVSSIAGAFSGAQIPLADLETGYAAVATYLTPENFAAQGSQEAVAHFRQRYGDRFSVRGAGAENDPGLTVLTMVGEAMALQSVKRGRVLMQAVEAAENMGIDTPFWTSPGKNALYLEVPTAKASDLAAAIYRQHFKERKRSRV